MVLCIPVVIIICYTKEVIVKVVAIIHPQFNTWWTSQLLISGLLFVILCLLITRSQRFVTIEERIQKGWFTQRNNWWWQLVATLFDPKLLVVGDFLFAAWLLAQGNKVRAIFVLTTLGTADACGIVIKHTLKRIRPASFTQNKGSYSFPSGHTLGITIMVLMLQAQLVTIWWHIALFVIWLLVVCSRLILHAHYLSDVLGALLFAYSWWIGAELLYLLIMR